jgi:hypothetical protein
MIWVQCFLASEGDHEGVLTQTMHLTGRVARPYGTPIFVGATLVVALARTANGTQTKTEVNA